MLLVLCNSKYENIAFCLDSKGEVLEKALLGMEKFLKEM